MYSDSFLSLNALAYLYNECEHVDKGTYERLN